MITVDVPLPGGRSYPVVIGPMAIDVMSTVLPATSRVAVVTQKGIGVEVETAGEQRVFTIPDGEPAKTLSTIEDLC
ncbi:MAG: 3-dehydroquinate synthase, partial [Actinobacteria bacterium]|nr:3-dehydroquinate synthase [Actinomycetota bacterium]